MNLTDFFRRDAAIEDHSLIDHSWMQNSGLAREDDPILNVESMKNPNNIKPELEVEWGLGAGDGDIGMDEPAGVVTRNIPEENLGDASAVILFARDMMNRGYRGRQVAASLKKKYPPALLKKASTGLRNLFALEGIVGRVLVDARGYKSCQAAIKATANSPFKGFIKYVYGCNCGDPHVLPMNDGGILGSIQASSGNGMDDFLGSGATATSKMVAHCHSTMMPIIAARGDLDKSDLDGTMVELMNLTPVPQGVISKIMAMPISNLAKARAAFRWLDKQVDAAEDRKYADAVDNSEFIVQQADNEIDIFDGPEAGIEVDGTNPALSTDIDYDPLGQNMFDGMGAIPGGMDEVEIVGEFGQEQLPVELMDERGSSALVEVNDPEEVFEQQDVEPAPVDMDVDFFGPGTMDISLDGEQEIPVDDAVQIFEPLDVNPQAGDMDATAPTLDNIDVDLADALSPEFEGIDEVELDDPTEVPDDLSVSLAPDMDIEL